MEVAVLNDVFSAYIHAVRNADIQTSICVSTASPKWKHTHLPAQQDFARRANSALVGTHT